MNLKSKLYKLFLLVGYTSLVAITKVFPYKSIGVRVCIIKQINNQPYIYLVRHSYKKPDFWYPPGGAVDMNEKVEDAAIREIREEVNIKAGSVEYVTHYLNKSQKNNYVFIYKTSDFVELENKLQYEIEEARWFPLKEVEKAAHNFLNGIDQNNKESTKFWRPMLRIIHKI